MQDSKSGNRCSFCGKKKAETKLLVAGLNGSICESCIDQAKLISEEELGTARKPIYTPNTINDKVTPKEISNFLDTYIIGQQEAKKVISVAVYNHYKRLNFAKNTSENNDIELEKSNVLLVGNTGTGKTLIAKTIAKYLNVPFAIVDATVFTEAGYVGEDVESILSRLLQVCDYNVELAEKGIIYIDEIDKISRKADNPSITRDVSGEGVQQAMLKLLEGSEVLVAPQGGRKHPDQKMVKVNTENILFICGGAFAGIEQKIADRLNTSVIGFSGSNATDEIDKDNLLQYVTPEDLRRFGLIPELIGRVPIISYLNPLDKEALTKILTEPKNALVKQYQKIFALDNIELSFDKNAINFIVDKALEYELGARGLRGICEAILNDYMFELPEAGGKTKIVITGKYAKEQFNKSKFSKLIKVA